MWESVRINDKKAVYRVIVTWEADVNAIHGQASPITSSLSLANVMRLHEKGNPDQKFPDTTSKSMGPQEKNGNPLDGCSLLHLACQTADIGMVELLLQHGANVNTCDSRGHTPLHHSIMRGRVAIAKLLLTRYGSARILLFSSVIIFLLYHFFDDNSWYAFQNIYLPIYAANVSEFPSKLVSNHLPNKLFLHFNIN